MTPMEVYLSVDGKLFYEEAKCLWYEKYEMEIDPDTGKPEYTAFALDGVIN